MNCGQCIKECKERGELCGPPSEDHALWYEPWMYEQERKHKRTAHIMTLSGGFYVCGGRHRVEASPIDTMRAAGITPML